MNWMNPKASRLGTDDKRSTMVYLSEHKPGGNQLTIHIYSHC